MSGEDEVPLSLYASTHVERMWSNTVLHVAMATALWSLARAGGVEVALWQATLLTSSTSGCYCLGLQVFVALENKV